MQPPPHLSEPSFPICAAGTTGPPAAKAQMRIREAAGFALACGARWSEHRPVH